MRNSYPDYIKRTLIIGDGARFVSEEHLYRVLTAMAKRFKVPLDTLINPDKARQDCKATLVLAAVMGLDHGELVQFNELAMNDLAIEEARKKNSFDGDITSTWMEPYLQQAHEQFLANDHHMPAYQEARQIANTFVASTRKKIKPDEHASHDQEKIVDDDKRPEPYKPPAYPVTSAETVALRIAQRKAAEAAAALEAAENARAQQAADAAAAAEAAEKAKAQARIDIEVADAIEDALAQAKNAPLAITKQNIYRPLPIVAKPELYDITLPPKPKHEPKPKPEPKPKAEKLPRPEKPAPVVTPQAEIIFPEGKRGAKLLAYADEQEWTLANLLGAMDASGALAEKYQQVLEWEKQPYQKHLFPKMNELADFLGAKNEEERALWRQLMMGVPADIDKRLADCLDINTPGHLDTDTKGFAHKIALAKFFKLITDSRGFPTRAPLVHAIVEQQSGVDKEELAKRLSYALQNVAGPIANADLNPHTMSAEELSVNDSKGKNLAADLAGMIAKYAYPDSPKLQKLATAFMNSEKYLASAATTSKNRGSSGKARQAGAAAAPQTPFALAFPAEKRGNELLAHSREQGWTFGQLLENIHELSGGSKNELAQALGIELPQYRKLASDEARRPPLEMANTLADKLGATNEAERAEWRKYIVGISADINQDTLNHCFEPDGSNPIDTTALNNARTVALAKFFKLLGDRHGFSERTKLAQAIAQSAGLGDAVALELRKVIDNTCGPQENADKDPSGDLGERDNRAKVIKNEMASLIANFAYPEDAVRQENCVEFLSSQIYYSKPGMMEKTLRTKEQKGRS